MWCPGNIDGCAAKEFRPAVADSAMLLLAATRHLLQADRFVRAGGWQEQWRVETPTVTGKRLGILGLGHIGSRIAQRAARGFDMAIGYHTTGRRSPAPPIAISPVSSSSRRGPIA
jgi:lactate dehydrogenase-like 2-hydroxyacid dehydrogenase